MLCMMTVSVNAAEITSASEISGDNIKVGISLSAMPSDLSEISSIQIECEYDNSKLEYIATATGHEKLREAYFKDAKIVWFVGTADKSFTAQDLESLDGYMFTHSFKKLSDGDTTIEITKIVMGDINGNATKDVTSESIVIKYDEPSDDTGSDNTGSDNTGSDNTGSDNTGSDNTGSDNTGSDNTGSDNTGSDNTGSDNTGSDNTGSDNTGSDDTGSGDTGSDDTGSGSSGSSGTGSGSSSSSGKGSGNKGSGGISFGGAPVNTFKGFSDIPSDHWGYTHAHSLMKKGIISGDGSEMPRMRPNDYITRQEAAKIALLAMGIKPEADLKVEFSDSALIADWAYPYIATAVKYGVITGYSDGTVGADKLITREQMLTILARAMKWQTDSTELTFADANDVSDWSRASIAYAVKKGVMTGYSDGTVKPKANISRIETFALVDRCLGMK